MCRLFGYSKQAYYKHCYLQRRRHCCRQQALGHVLALRQHLPRLGTRKLYYRLKTTFQAQQLGIGRDKLFEVLRAEGLLVVRKRKYVKTTNSQHWMRKYPNRIKDLPIERPEQVWVADITYLDTQSGFHYLHLVTDAYSKQIMGYELCDNMLASSSLKALKMALANRQYPENALTHHSDRGLQYCSTAYTNLLTQHGITISMTEQSDPYENAIAERVNGILKEEFGLGDCFEEVSQLMQQTQQSIQLYNEERPHLSNHYLTPALMHQQCLLKRKTWASKKQSIDPWKESMLC